MSQCLWSSTFLSYCAPGLASELGTGTPSCPSFTEGCNSSLSVGQRGGKQITHTLPYFRKLKHISRSLPAFYLSPRVLFKTNLSSCSHLLACSQSMQSLNRGCSSRGSPRLLRRPLSFKYYLVPWIRQQKQMLKQTPGTAETKSAETFSSIVTTVH